MDHVYIIGAGQVPVGKHPDQSLAAMGAAAIGEALTTAKVPAHNVKGLFVGNMMSGQLCNQQLISTLIANQAGLTGCATITAEGACASGGAAVHLGYMAIASGCYDTVVVAGVEKMTHMSTPEITQKMATASHWPTEGGKGETFVSLNATFMERYMSTYNVDSDVFAGFAINAHKNAMTSPYAMFHKELDREGYHASRHLSGPIKIMDAPPMCDGAAAVVLGNHDVAKAAQALGIPIVRIMASAVACDHLAIADRESLVRLAAAESSAQSAYRQAGLKPADIDVFEPHDAYTVMTALSLEACGFAEPGAGIRFSEADIGLNGKLPITTFGGLKARGHPVGATGVYQIAECFLQLTDAAGDNQVKDARIAMAQNFGGTASFVTTHIMERVT